MTTLPATTAGPAKAGELLPALRAETAKDLVLKSDIVSVCATALPHGVDSGRWWRAFRTYLNKTPGLIECTVDSLYQALMEIAQSGLIIGGTLQEAFIVPFKDNKKGVVLATVIYGYKGLIVLVYNETQMVIHAREVYDKDHFEWREGTDYYVAHTPTLESKPGEVRASYAIGIYPDGRKEQEVMTRDQLEKIKQNSRGASQAGSAYQTWGEMMFRKAPIRRLCNRLPKATKAREAISREDARLEALGFYGARHVEQAPIAMPREVGTPAELPASTPEAQLPEGETSPPATDEVQTFVAEAKEKTYEDKKTKETKKYYVVEFSDGVIASTFSESLFDVAHQAGADRKPVRYTTVEGKGGKKNLQTLELAPEPERAEGGESGS